MKLRDLFLPRHPVRSAEAVAPARASAPVRLESTRYERRGVAHRAQLRAHADGTGLLIVDAQQIVPLSARGVAAVRRALESGQAASTAPHDVEDATSIERLLAREDVGTGSPLLLAANPSERQPLPAVPLVATMEVSAGAPEPWTTRVRKLHDLAIPHVVLRPDGEPAAANVLACVRAAEDLGLVCGAAAPADFVDDGSVLDELASAGLDHLALVLGGADAATHDAVAGHGDHARTMALVARATALDVPLTAEIPLAESSWTDLKATLAAARPLGFRGATAWALVGDGPGLVKAGALRQVATTFEHAADGAALPITWAAPARCRSLAEGLARGPRTDGDYGMRVRSDGAVLAPRGPEEPAGWLEAIVAWDDVVRSAPWRAFAERAGAATRCGSCPGLQLCAIDCPAAPEGWS